jgi:predicted phosphodiesterase
MQLHILSDIHLEFAPFTPPRTTADVVILAGDTQPGIKGVVWAQKAFDDRHVVYVAGNHEYYGQSIPKHFQKLNVAAQGSNVHVLENDAFTIGDVVFLGCTFWTDFELFGSPRVAGYFATQNMNDYRRIRVDPEYRRLRSIDTAMLHYHSRHWLEKQFEEHHGAKIVVVTHHAPSPRSLPDNYEEDILYAASASNLDEFVQRSGASLWVHGHRHITYDYHIGKTHVICNPRGYFGEQDSKYNPDLVMSV